MKQLNVSLTEESSAEAPLKLQCPSTSKCRQRCAGSLVGGVGGVVSEAKSWKVPRCAGRKRNLEFGEVSSLRIGEESRRVVYRSSDRVKEPRVPHKPKLILVLYVDACNFRLPRRPLTSYIQTI